MFFLIATLVLQFFSPAPQGGSLVAATCMKPDTDAFVTKAVKPELPHGMTASGSVNVAVTIAPDGHVVRTTMVKSSGNSTLDHAAVVAARNTSYSPKIVNCKPVQGGYVFHADFSPNP